VADASVRPARVGEAAEIARIQRDTLAMAYEAVMPPEVMAQLVDPTVRAAILDGITAQIAARADDARVLVALEGEQLVGFAFVQAAVRDGMSLVQDGDPAPETTGFLEQILVEPRWGRRGHGSRLLAAATEFFTEAGFTRAITWVPDTNAATTSFLESAGWARDGYARGLDTGAGAMLREIRFHTSL
jgi:GNAT superfamily N-acetyltransferase